MSAKFMVSFIAVLMFVSCNHINKNQISTDLVNNPNTASGKAADNLPMFKFAEETHNFGRVIEGEKVSYSFEFTNVGKSDLLIASASASCGCTVAEYPKIPIQAGGKGFVKVQFNTEGKKGMQTKTITLMSNTQPNTKVLTIKAEVYSPEKKN
jgi:hypothetical protein